MLSRGRRARSHRGIVSRPIIPHQCPRLLELRFRRFQILIGNIDLLFQRVQLRVLKNLPPFALGNLIAGLRRLPVRRDFFVCGRRRHGRLRIARANCATAEEADCRTSRKQASDLRPQPSAKSPEPKSEVRGPRSDARPPPSSLCPLRVLGDPDGLDRRHRVRRIEDHIFIAVQGRQPLQPRCRNRGPIVIASAAPSGPVRPWPREGLRSGRAAC